MFWALIAWTMELGKDFFFHLEIIYTSISLEFGRYSLDYHTIRNYLYVNRAWGKERADRHMPAYAKKLVDLYNQNGKIDEMLSNK
ncbi:hypothetical protein K1719_029249 [Acacia pycnantha]|nr:hypothetical protein K1719_029249 [Acacia pycnantha]